ncbi:MAG: FAD-dependent oxidoreductase [Actinomycetota bacterium]|nr:FAD-dependent oxidoreductase [Actinomycetota bacterium]
MAEIVIIGSGPAGLMAAWRAAELGHEVKVFESAPTVGGMSGSFDVAGLRVDYGSHRLHPSTPPHLLNRISSLLGDDLQTRERNGRIRLYDRWVSFPLRTTNMIRHLPLSF